MKRRGFLSTSIGTGSALTALAGCEQPSQREIAQAPAGRGITVKLAGRTLEELREEYRYWLKNIKPLLYLADVLKWTTDTSDSVLVGTRKRSKLG